MDLIKSPCIRKCKLDQNKCTGCRRTIEEIKGWRDMNDLQKTSILNRITIEKYWPDLSLPPINLWVVYPAKYL